MADLSRKIERKLSDIEVCISRAKARGNKQRVVQLIQEKLTRQKQLKNLKQVGQPIGSDKCKSTKRTDSL